MNNNQSKMHQVVVNQKAESPQEKPYSVFGISFASKKVLVDFLIATLLIVVVPLFLVVISNHELQKVAYAVIPSIVFMNIVIIIYVYRVIKDPENYKKDPPLVIRPKQQ